MQVAPVNFEKSRRSLEEREGDNREAAGVAYPGRNSERRCEPSLLKRKSRARGAVRRGLRGRSVFAAWSDTRADGDPTVRKSELSCSLFSKLSAHWIGRERGF